MKTALALPARIEVGPATREEAPPRFVMKLYVAGQSPKSVSAIANIKRICEEYLHGRYELEVIDLYQEPELAAGEQLIAVPTLVRQFPAPPCRIIGDMSNTERVLLGLDIREPRVASFNARRRTG